MKFLNWFSILILLVTVMSFTVLQNTRCVQIQVKKPTRKDVKESLSRLKNDTLYVINRTCSGKFSNDKLTQMFLENYTFSEVRVLQNSKVKEVSKQKNIVHYAVIGQYYTDIGSPLTNGIYLLDEKSELCTKPYPYHVREFWFSYLTSKCMRDERSVGELISQFDGKLIKATR